MSIRSHLPCLSRSLTFLGSIVLLVSGCVKEDGIGGKAEIHGRVIEQHHTNSGTPVGDPYPRPGLTVYISHGDQDGHDDDVETGADGRFRFPWLRKGTYRIYTFGECLDCPGGSVVVSRLVELEDRKDLEDIGDLQIANY